MMKSRVSALRAAFLGAFTCFAIQAADPGCLNPDTQQSILSQLQSRTAEQVLHAHQYLCREAIDRRWYRAPVSALKTRECVQAVGNDEYSLFKYDKVRLDVAVRGEAEIFSWPGAGTFDTPRIDKLVLGGPILSGTFVAFLNDVFVKRRARITCYSVDSTSGGTALRFEFVTPQTSSSFIFQTGTGQSVVGYQGSFSVATKDGALRELQISATDLPVASPFCSIEIEVNYPDGEDGFSKLIPNSVQLSLYTRDGEKEGCTFVYKGCQEFLATSKLVFGNEPPSGSHVNDVNSATTAATQPGANLWIRLTSIIDTGTAAAGDLINGVVTRTEVASTGFSRSSKRLPVSGHIISAAHFPQSGSTRILVTFDGLGANSNTALAVSLTRIRRNVVSGQTTYSIRPIEVARSVLEINTRKGLLKSIPITEWEVVSDKIR